MSKKVRGQLIEFNSLLGKSIAMSESETVLYVPNKCIFSGVEYVHASDLILPTEGIELRVVRGKFLDDIDLPDDLTEMVAVPKGGAKKILDDFQDRYNGPTVIKDITCTQKTLKYLVWNGAHLKRSEQNRRIDRKKFTYSLRQVDLSN